MGKKVFSSKVLFMLLLTTALFAQSVALAAEKLRFGNGFKWAPMYTLIDWATQERGIWKKHGLEVEWFGFRGGTDMHQAFAGRALDMGITGTPGVLEAVSKGLPEVIVAQFPATAHFYVFVPPNSPIRKPKDLKGAKIAIMKKSGTAYAYALFGIKSVGLSEKDVTFLGVGGLRGRLAALKSGTAQALVVGREAVPNLLVTGQIRGLVNIYEYLPKPWTSQVIIARKAFLERKPAVVNRMKAAVSEAVEFVRANRSWAAEKLRTKGRLSDAAAKLMAEEIYSPDLSEKINRKGIENVARFLVEYGVVPKGKIPPLDKILYTGQR